MEFERPCLLVSFASRVVELDFSARSNTMNATEYTSAFISVQSLGLIEHTFGGHTGWLASECFNKLAARLKPGLPDRIDRSS